MPRRQSTGEIRVWLATALANPAAPTVAEVNAATDLTPFMRRDGLSTPKSANTVDNSDASSRQDKTSRGTFSAGPVVYTGYRDSTTDTAWTSLADGTTGFLIVRRFGGSAAAPAAGQKVEVWPVEVNSRSMADIGDENQRFSATLVVPDVIYEDATVAV